MRRTKIICTLGPASSSEEKITQLVEAGMNVARFNFSHGSHPEHLEKLNILTAVREKLDLPIATLLDTKGPEIRVCSFEKSKIQLNTGDEFVLCTDDVVGNESMVSVTYKNLTKDVKVTDTILIDDGLIELRVKKISGNKVICDVVNGGPVSNNKGVNIPGVEINMPYLSERDKSDIKFGVENDFDFIAASFVRSADDVLQIRKYLESLDSHDIKIISKIENSSGVDNADAILKVSDGIMIARGDMGVEIPFTQLPSIQKKLIKKSATHSKIVITATQMLESMINNPRPTRAEATDVANAVYDGTSAIMLSGETAAGKYPVEAVRAMDSIAKTTEQDIDYKTRFFTNTHFGGSSNITKAISHATCITAYDLSASAIITVTRSGQTANLISKYRPSIQIVGCTSEPKVYRQLALSWGVKPVICEEKHKTSELFEHAVDRARARKYVNDGDIAVITTGLPLNIPGTTNLIKVQTVGNVLVSGKGINKDFCTGKICVVNDINTAKNDFAPGDIIVAKETNNDMLDMLKEASAIITEVGGVSSHAAIVGLALEIPVVIGAVNATQILKTGTTVLVDAQKGIVCTSNHD